MQDLIQGIDFVLGIGEDDFSMIQMPIRAVIVYLSALLFVRAGEKRFFGKSTAFDLILGIIFGSVVSRGINGSADLVPTLAAGATLIGCHWLLAAVSFHYSSFGTLVKGRPRILVRDGKADPSAMRRSHISMHDLETALRENVGREDLSGIEEARLERSGAISFVKRSEPREVEVEVREDVQTIRIRLER